MSDLGQARRCQRRAVAGEIPLRCYPTRERDPLRPLRQRGYSNTRRVSGTAYTVVLSDEAVDPMVVGAAWHDVENGMLYVYGLDLPEYAPPARGKTPREHVALSRADWALVLGAAGHTLGEDERASEAVRAVLERAKGQP